MKIPRPGISDQRGFTIIELMVTIAILGVLLSLAAPSFSTLIENQRAKSAAADLYASLVRARSEAVKRNTSMTLSPKSADWKSGWQIMDPTSGAAIEDHGEIRGLSLAGPDSVTYRSSGRISGNTQINFNLSGNHSSSARCIYLDLSGRPAIRTGACPS